MPRDYYTGTNSVRTRSFVAEVHRGQELCVPALRLPAGTGRVQFEIDTSTNATMAAAVRAAGEPTLRSRVVGVGPGRQKVAFPIPERPEAPASVRATACVEVFGEKVFFGGMGALQANDLSPELDGRAVGSRVAVWFLPPEGERRSIVSLLPDIFERAALFRPGIVGPWTYLLLAFAVLPMLVYAGLRLVATARSPRRRVPLVVVVAAIGFTHAGVWALLTPPFDAPDESEHFAYAQHFAETGKAVGGPGAVYSTEQTVALDAVRTFSRNETPDGKPPWLPVEERGWQDHLERAGGADAPRANGGGFTAATSSHSPLYYSLLAPAYHAAADASIWSRLTLMRLVSALLAAVVAAFAFLIVRELLPNWPLVAVGAGLLVAFQPMFAFMGGSINNDMGVNAAAAVVLYLVVRALRRGVSVRLGAALGVALVAMPLMKFSGFALAPAAGLGVATVAFRDVRAKRRAAMRGWSALFGAGVAAALGWIVVSGSFDRHVFTTPGGGTPVADTAQLGSLTGYLSYIWQVFLPKLPFMTDLISFDPAAYYIYGIRGWGAFGWYAIAFPSAVYGAVILMMLVVGALGAVALWRNARRVPWAPIITLVAAIALVIIGIHVSFYSPAPRPVIPEFGRYLFPAIAALAAGAMACCFAFGRRFVAPIATALVTAVMGLALASLLLALFGFYAGETWSNGPVL